MVVGGYVWLSKLKFFPVRNDGMDFTTDSKDCFQGANIQVEFNNDFIDLVRREDENLTCFLTF